MGLYLKELAAKIASRLMALGLYKAGSKIAHSEIASRCNDRSLKKDKRKQSLTRSYPQHLKSFLPISPEERSTGERRATIRSISFYSEPPNSKLVIFDW